MLSSLPSPYAVTVKPDAPAFRGAELVTTDGRSLPLVGAKLTGDARGGIARLVLEQRFENRYAETLHVTYRMPLPADGAVSGYAFEIAGAVVSGRVEKKADAREQFERAIAAGQTAALLEQERADIFTQDIGNVPAGDMLIARITIDARLAWLVEGAWELRFPTVIGPRYIGTADSAADVAATEVDVSSGDIGARLGITIRIGDTLAGRPASPTHALSVRDDVVELRAEAGARLDRDIVVRWPVAEATVGVGLATARRASGQAHGLVTIVPPAPAAQQRIPRDLIVLLDTSGSMGGAPLDKAKQVTGMVIESLGEGDRLELIEFSSSAHRYTRDAVEATPAAKQKAIAWVNAREAGGGTEMYSGVLEALANVRAGAQRQVIVVTDGLVGGEARIIKALRSKLPASCRLHVLGVGSCVNRSLATALARAGRGAEVIADLDEDVERAAVRLIAKTRAPVLTEVTISGSALIVHAPEHVPDVYAGSPVLAALALRPDGGELVVRGKLAIGAWEQHVHVPAMVAGRGEPALAALYARERVSDLEIRAVCGDECDKEIEALGLDYQIATRLTSWVAIDERRRAGDGPARHESVPQELPYGTTAAAFGLRPAGGFPQLELAAMAQSFAGPPLGRAAPGYAPTLGVGAKKLRVSSAAPQAYSKAPRSLAWLYILVLVLVLAALAWWLI